jgi:uncharacterized protein YndB with AHSA1/START domain
MNYNPELDLTVERTIAAPRRSVWRAWTDPAHFERWWIPAPARCRVDRLEVRSGGGLVTSWSEDGVTFEPQLSACFILVEDQARIVFSNAIDGDRRPADPAPVAMTAEVTMADHPEGTDYRIIVRHGDPGARARHADLGFADGWGTVARQLADLVEGEAR